MFRNRSFGLVVVLAVLSIVTLILGTGVAAPSSAPSGNGVTVVVKAHPKGYAELKESQLDQLDAAQFGNASIEIANREDSYYAMQKDQRDMQKEQRAASEAAPSALSAAVEAARRERYAALKDAQLEQDDARIGTATFSIQGPTIDRCRPHRGEPDCEVR